MGTIPARMLYLSTLEFTKYNVRNLATDKFGMSPTSAVALSDFCAGASASCAAQAIIVPIDVVSQNMMIASKEKGGAPPMSGEAPRRRAMTGLPAAVPRAIWFSWRPWSREACEPHARPPHCLPAHPGAPRLGDCAQNNPSRGRAGPFPGGGDLARHLRPLVGALVRPRQSERQLLAAPGREHALRLAFRSLCARWGAYGLYNRLLTLTAEEELGFNLSSPGAQFTLQTGAGVCAGATSGLLTTPLARAPPPPAPLLSPSSSAARRKQARALELDASETQPGG